MFLPKEIIQKIFYFWLDIEKKELHWEFHEKKPSQYYLRKYSWYYHFPEYYLHYLWNGILRQTFKNKNEIIFMMRYLVENKYRLDKTTLKYYYIKIVKMGRRENIDLFTSYYRFIFL